VCTYKSYSNTYVPGNPKQLLSIPLKSGESGGEFFDFEKVRFLLENKFKKRPVITVLLVFETILIFTMGAFFLKLGSGYK